MSEKRSPAVAALVEGWPILATTVVTGVTFGVVARQSGLEPAAVVAMSLLVFAGASQFVAVQLLAAGAGTPLIVATVFAVNLRHALMATALRPALVGLPLARRLAAAFVLTDEAFAMGIGWWRRGRREVSYYATFAVALYVLWNASTAVGVGLGEAIAEPRRFGIDFAITATFVGIVALSARTRTDAAVALAGAAIAAARALGGASSVAVVVAGLSAPLLAIVLPGRARP